MATMAEDKTCAHPQCSCPVSGDQEYCCQSCADSHSRNDVESDCGCNHAQCARAA